MSKLADKAAAKGPGTGAARLRTDAPEEATDRVSALDLWTRSPPGERRTRITRDELAAAAVRIADVEGFAALSMRRLAQEVGVGTMTLYHYVRNKDELLTVVFDAVMGEVVVPDDDLLPQGWRPALTGMAERSRAAIERHPWMLDIADDPPIGPNSVRHFDQMMQAVSSLDVPLADRLDIVAAVDEFVFGYCLFERNNLSAAAEPEPDMEDYFSLLLETGAYPTIADLVRQHGISGLWQVALTALAAPDRFRRHLDRLLDGIAADLARRASG